MPASPPPEWRLCTLCQIMTQKAAAKNPAAADLDPVQRAAPVITRVRNGHTIRGLTTLGVDEISYCKGRKFATLVYDLDRARVLWVGRGKGATPSIASSTTGEPGAESAGRLGQLRHESRLHRGDHPPLPHVTLVIDRFHLVKALNQAVDDVRKEQWRALDTQGRKAIKGLRWLLSRALPTSYQRPHSVPQ